MEGVTTAIVAFIFVCIIYPKLVRHRAQFYAAIGAIVIILLFQSLAYMIGSGGFGVFVRALTGLLLLVAFVLMILSTGGLSLHELTTDVRGAFEVIRRGEEQKEVIIPRTGQTPAHTTAADRAEEPRRNVYTINSAEPSAASSAPPPEPPHAPFPPPTPSDQTTAPTPPLSKPDDTSALRSSIPLE
jgi:hypothetical protein